MDPLISVIVPIYNVEIYLKRCIDSILNQTYKNIEIILVDDGSPDNCSVICDEYAMQYNRIKVIHKENGGLSDGRNCGINIANGEYISFIDSDDFVAPVFIETLYNMCKKYGCDISQCNFESVICDDLCEYVNASEVKVYSNNQMIKNIYSEMYVLATVTWNKLYKTKLFENIRYPKGKIHEDEATTYKLYYYANKIAVSDVKLYGYFMSPNSIMRSDFSIKRLDYIDAVEERVQFFREKDEKELYDLVLKSYCFSLVDFYCKLKKNIGDSNGELKKLKIKYKNNYKIILKNNSASLKAKGALFLFRWIPNAYSLFIR